MSGDDARSSAFARDAFARYYASHRPAAPPWMERREFAFTHFGRDGMHRPVVFSSAADLGAFLAREAPRHAYYSSATYTNPDAPMSVKKWTGADLLFDLDADHLPGAKEMTYEEMLGRVKNEFAYLLEEFLIGDLGFDPKHMFLTFSGGRGYHCHYRDPRVLPLRNPERREIVDHLLGRTLDKKAMFPPGALERVKDVDAIGGWPGRVLRGVLREVELLARLPRGGTEVTEVLTAMLATVEPAVPEPRKKAAAICKTLFTRHGNFGGGKTTEPPSPPLEDITGERRIEQFTRAGQMIAHRSFAYMTGDARLDAQCDLLIDAVIAKVRVKGLALAEDHPLRHGETDVTVTGDEKRIIRLPGSLHGKTGFVVTPIAAGDDPVAAVKGFDPFTSAVAPLAGAVKVRGTRGGRVRLLGEEHAVAPGEEAELPVAAALFFVLRGDAEAAA